MGIVSKITSKADWAAAILAAWGELEDIGSIISYYTNLKGGALNEVKNTLTWKGLLMAKLGLNGDAAYGENMGGTIAKYSALAWVLSDFGIIPPKWKGVATKAFKGGLFAAFTLPAPGGAGGGGSSGGTAGMIY